MRRKKVTIKGDQGEPAKDLSMVKLVFSLEHMHSEWMNSKNVPWLDEARSFYKEFRVDLLIWRSVDLVGRVERTLGNSPYVSRCGLVA